MEQGGDAAQTVLDMMRDDEHRQDILRFRDFSDGYIARHPSLPGVLGDVRYAMLPTSARPLWGITLDLSQPSRHAGYNFYRQMSQVERQQFLAMLLGRDP